MQAVPEISTDFPGEFSELLRILESYGISGGQAMDALIGFFYSFAVGIMVIALLYNLATCFFGYRMFKVMVAIIGGLIGFVIGLVIGVAADANSTVTLLIAAASCVLFAFLAFKLYKIGVFFYCGILGASLLTLITGSGTAGFIAFIVFGVLGVILTRPYIVGITAISGGLAAASALGGLLNMNSRPLVIVIGAVLAVLGILFQWKTTKDTDASSKGGGLPPKAGGGSGYQPQGYPSPAGGAQPQTPPPSSAGPQTPPRDQNNLHL